MTFATCSAQTSEADCTTTLEKLASRRIPQICEWSGTACSVPVKEEEEKPPPGQCDAQEKKKQQMSDKSCAEPTVSKCGDDPANPFKNCMDCRTPYCDMLPEVQGCMKEKDQVAAPGSYGD